MTMLLIDDAIDRATADRLRTGLAFERYRLLDRGSYEHATITTAIDPVIARARSALGRPLELATARVLRLVPGDYLLAHHDPIDTGIEIVVDLSPLPVTGAAVHYRRRGWVHFAFPSQPLAMAIVERGPTVTSNHTYVSKLSPSGTEVVRLVALCR